MKIKINENETYEFKIDEEISFNKLKELVKRIEILCEGSIPEIKPKIAPSPQKKSVGRPKKYKKHNKDDDLLKNVKCISCGSQRLYKKGITKDGGRRIICKNCNVSFTVPQNGGQPIKARQRISIKWNRNEAINAYKVHYFGSTDDKSSYAEKINARSWENIAKALTNLRQRYNILPQELGLQEFPVLRGQSATTRSANLKSQIRDPQQESRPQEEPQESFVQSTPQPPLEVKKEGEEEEIGDRPKQWWNRK